MAGVNGSGKSIILKLLAGIEPMDVDYRKICEGKSRISYPSVRLSPILINCRAILTTILEDKMKASEEEMKNIDKSMSMPDMNYDEL